MTEEGKKLPSKYVFMHMRGNIGVLIYTHHRVHDARINMEIIRHSWKGEGLLNDVVIVHAYNGNTALWPKKYLEDKLVRTKNPGHWEGADMLISAGLKAFAKHYPEVDYVIVLAADTWCLRPAYLMQAIERMMRERKSIATCSWNDEKKEDMFYAGMALDLFIVDIGWATTYRLFPLRYKEFAEKYGEVFLYQDNVMLPERILALRFRQAVMRASKLPQEWITRELLYERVLHLKEREPIHKGGARQMYWQQLGLLTHHDPEEKRSLLKKWNPVLGSEGKRVLESGSLSYFNDKSSA